MIYNKYIKQICNLYVSNVYTAVYPYSSRNKSNKIVSNYIAQKASSGANNVFSVRKASLIPYSANKASAITITIFSKVGGGGGTLYTPILYSIVVIPSNPDNNRNNDDKEYKGNNQDVPFEYFNIYNPSCIPVIC